MNTFFIETYGCQMNKADSINVIESLKINGFNPVDNPENADFVIINTCSVRKTAENRIWGRLGFYKNLRNNSNITVLVMGCMSQRIGEELLYSNYSVDIVVGNYYKDKIPEIIKNFQKGQKVSYITEKEIKFSDSFPDEINPKKAFVNINHGCNNFCSYCIVPYLRGREVSRPSGDIIKDINNLVNLGVIQVTLLGQNVNSYGRDSNDISFAGLLKKISKETDIKWIKYLSSHPRDFTEELIEVIANENKISKWLHLAVQSGSNNILKKMNRHYTIESYIDKIKKLKTLVPDIYLTTDIIVGFPSETEEDFLNTYELVKEIQYDDAYMYKYNIRENTFAANNLIDDIEDEIKINRLKKIIDLQKKISIKNKEKRIGNIYEVISDKWSKKSNKEILGLSKDEFMILFKGTSNDFNNILKIKTTKIQGNTLFGEKI